jgi:hypothetical protein
LIGDEQANEAPHSEASLEGVELHEEEEGLHLEVEIVFLAF